ncbi:MAG: glutamate-1-semialdehyde 2,1-aminomutase [Bacteriovoracaceae bacterium]|nr:glutamate-1-semialdehyde 2,1-aminomutase [Bacteriovoracaceae bacterium]
MFTNKQAQELAHKYIPGGAHTYSRGDDQFPSNAPAVLSAGKGCYVWDVEGKKFLDYGMGLRSVGIGYAEDRVSEAAFREIKNGNNLTRASEIEIIAAQKICELIPSIEMVKFAKHGSAVTSASVKLARAVTGKNIVVRCLEHPFFSYDDWFIGNTVVNSGVPEDIQKLTVYFNYNNIDSLKRIFESHKDKIACVIMEAVTTVEPCASTYFPGTKKHFLHDVQHLCKQNNSLFIIDEMITGFRWHNLGAAHYYDIDPDLITFGKAMANGFSVAALGGKREYMERGGIHHQHERVFLTSTTHGAEMCGMGALVETINIYQERNIPEHMWSYGRKLTEGINGIAKDLGIEKNFFLSGIPCSPIYSTLDKDLNLSWGLRTLFNQEMIKQKIIMAYVSISYAHKESELDQTLTAAKTALKVYEKGLNDGFEKYLQGHILKPVFRKFN